MLALRAGVFGAPLARRVSVRQCDRRGALYIAVMFLSLIVSAMGLASIHIARLTLETSTGSFDRHEAEILASSAIENGLMVVDGDPNWRTNFASGTENPGTPVALGSGTFTWQLVDDDGDLADDPADTVLLQGIGRIGNKVHVEQVRLQPTESGLTCLEASFHTNGQITFSFGATWTTNQFISTNKSGSNVIEKTGSGVLNGNAEAVGTIQNSAVMGTETEGITPRQMPGDHVFDYYVNMGTAIDINMLPVSMGKRMLEKLVLSPNSNPYGNPNPEGIYVIDCQNQGIRVKLVRMLGTLVLLNPGFASDFDNDMHFEPAVPNYPALLVQGNMSFNWHGDHNLRESMAGVNYNPPGTPYEGQEDTDQVDEYPPQIKGLTYISGYLAVTKECIVKGCLIADSIPFLWADMTLTYDATHLNAPPPGFASGNEMEIIPGSWSRAASP